MDEEPDRAGAREVAPGAVVMPASVSTASALVWAIVALSGFTALLTWLLRDELVRAWASDNPEASALLREGGIEALDASAISVPEFVPLAATSFAVIAGLALVLVAFLRSGHNWARWCLVALVAFALFSTGVSISRGLPATFVALAGLSVLLNTALLWFLFRPDTTRYLRID